jgi:hypothetical protein
VRERVPDAERMTVDERRKCLKRMQGRYLAASRQERGRLLDELAELTGLHRYSVVRLLKGPSLERQPRRGQRGREYGAAVDDALRVIWESLDYVCAERLTPALVSTAEQLARHGEMAVTEEVLGTFHGSDEFPIEWQEGEKELFWIYDDLHIPNPVSPMFFDIGGWWLTCDHMFRRFGTPFASNDSSSGIAATKTIWSGWSRKI